jgi:hypothetical protein
MTTKQNLMSPIQSFCKKHGITEDQFYGREKITGDLYLGSVTSLPDGFNPTVGGYLYLGSVTSLPDGFNPTVGGYLYLGSVTSLPDGFNPTVGGYLYWKNGSKYIGSRIEKPLTTTSFFWDGFAKIDGIFCQVDDFKTKTINGEVYEIRTTHRIGKSDATVIVSKDNFHAHGKDFKTAFADLQFKIQSHKLKSEPITVETLVTVAHYRAITGACNFGCKDFMNRHKLKYSIHNEGEHNEFIVEEKPVKAKDLLKLLKKDNAYGADRFEKLMQAV